MEKNVKDVVVAEQLHAGVQNSTFHMLGVHHLRIFLKKRRKN